MRGLYEVFTVDPEDSTVINDGPHYTIATCEESAKIRVVLALGLTKDIDEYDIIVQKIGCVRAKKDK